MTKAQMQEVINKLHSRISRTAVECVYCHGVFAVNDPAWAEHWRECPAHPARASFDELRTQLRQAQDEAAELRSQLKWTALELDRCRAAEKVKANDGSTGEILQVSFP